MIEPRAGKPTTADAKRATRVARERGWLTDDGFIWEQPKERSRARRRLWRFRLMWLLVLGMWAGDVAYALAVGQTAFAIAYAVVFGMFLHWALTAPKAS